MSQHNYFQNEYKHLSCSKIAFLLQLLPLLGKFCEFSELNRGQLMTGKFSVKSQNPEYLNKVYRYILKLSLYFLYALQKICASISITKEQNLQQNHLNEKCLVTLICRVREWKATKGWIYKHSERVKFSSPMHTIHFNIPTAYLEPCLFLCL